MTTDLESDALTQAVIDSFGETPDERLKDVLVSLTRHLHGFVRDVAPSIDEWQAAIDFLTSTGQKCDDVRQEFVLFSDILGVSMLVENLNGQETPDATDATVLGPFHMVESPARQLGDNISVESEGEACLVRGRVISTTGDPIPGAEIDVWQANSTGYYDVQQPGIQSIGNGRGLFRADDQGEFHFVSIVPSHYPIPTDGPVGGLLNATKRHPYRPAHIHFIVTAPGYAELTTHIFVAGSPYIESDAVFAVKRSLVRDFVLNHNEAAGARYGIRTPFREAAIDIVLDPTGISTEPVADEIKA